jgi:hypothetical protein
MKALKVVAIIVSLLVLVIVGIGFYVVRNTDRLFEAGIETLGTRYLGAAVTVDSVDVSLSEGRARLQGLSIANPPGYEGDHAMRMASIGITLDPMASKATHLALRNVTIEGAEVFGVVGARGTTNIQALIDNLERTGGTASGAGDVASDVRLSIETLDLTGAQASVVAPSLGKQSSTRIPDLHLKDLGGGSGSAAVADVLRQILTPIARSVLLETVEQGLGDDVLRGKLDDAMNRLRNLGHPE